MPVYAARDDKQGCGPINRVSLLFATRNGIIRLDGRRPSAYGDAVCFFRSGRQTLAAPAPGPLHYRDRGLSRRHPFRPDAVCRAAAQSSLFPPAVERAAQIPPTGEPGRAAAGESGSLGKVYRRPAGVEETPRPGAGPAGAPAKEIAGQRSASRLLHERRSLQLYLAGTTREPDHASLSGMDGDDQWFG